jgi:phosphohistidine phosphatase
MDILLVRHGEAVDEAPGLGDAGRWLTGKGRKVTRKVGRWLADRSERGPKEIWSSPLVRAVQTAEILAEQGEIVDGVSVAIELSPSHDPREVLKRLDQHAGDGPLALVGHEPNLSMLTTALLGDIAFPGFKKSGVLCVSYKNGSATFRFFVVPKDMQIVTDVRKLAG